MPIRLPHARRLTSSRPPHPLAPAPMQPQLCRGYSSQSAVRSGFCSAVRGEAPVHTIVSTCSVAPHWGLQLPPCCGHHRQEGGCYWSGRSAGLVPQCREGEQGWGQGRKRAGLAVGAPARGSQAGPRRLSGGLGLALPGAQVPGAVPARWRAGARRCGQHWAPCPSGSCGECGD